MATGSALRDLSIHVSLNDTSIRSGLTSLTRLVKASTNSWKADMLSFENSGDHMSALQAKFKGLSDSITGQKKIIHELSQEQQAMGQRTEKNAAEWDGYTLKISRAQKQMASMAQQQQRTSDAIKFESTGIRTLRNSYDALHAQVESSVSIYEKQGNQLTATRAKMLGYREEISKLQEIERRESTVLGEINQKFGSQSDEYSKQATRVNKLKSTIASYSVTAENGFKRVGNATKADTLSIDSVTRKYNRLSGASQKLRNIGSSMLSTTLSVGAGFIYAAKQASTLENSYRMTNNLLVTGGEKSVKATKAVTDMQKDGEKYSIKYAKSMANIAAGYQELVKRGYSSKQALGSMKSILQASVASGDSYNDIVKVTTATLESFGMRVKSTSGMMKNTKTVTNELAYAADMSATSFKDIGTAMEYVGPTAKQAHVSLSETSAILGVLSNNGLEAQKAGTGVRKIFNSLLSPTKAASKILKEYNIRVKDSKGNMLSMSTIFGKLNKAFAGMGSAQKSDLFHKLFGTTGQNAASLLADNVANIDKLNKKIRQAPKNNYVTSLSGKNMKSAQNQLNIFKQSATALGVEFAKELLPEVTKFTQAMVPLVRKLSNASDGTKKVVVAGAALVALAGPIMSLTGIIGMMGSGFLKVDAAYKRLSMRYRKSSIDIDQATAARKSDIAVTDAETASVEANTKAHQLNNSTIKTSIVDSNGKPMSTSSKKVASAKGNASDLAITERTEANARGAMASAEKSTFSGSRVLASLKGMSWLDKGMIGLTFADAGLDTVKAVKDGLGSKKGGSELWSGGGKAIGAGLGLVLGGGDPLTGMIGSAIGGAIGKGLASSKSVKEISAAISKANDKNKPKTAAEKADLKTATKVATGDTGAQYDGINYSMAVANMDKAFETSTEKAYKTLPKTVQKANDSITKGLAHANAKFATGLASDTSTSAKNIKAINSSTYSSIEKTLSSYTSKQTSASKKRLDEMVKAGAMTKKQENTILKNENNSYNTRLNNAKKSLNSLSGIEIDAQQKMANQNKKYNSQVSTLEKQKNAAILSLEKGGTAKLNGEVVQGKTWEKEITESYNKKINAAEKANQKARNKITSDALKTRYLAEFKAESEVDDVISSGSKKQKSILRKASADNGGLSKKQADKMISESTRSMNKVVKDAKSTYSKTKKSANDKYKATTAAAKKEFETNPDFSEKQYKAVMKSAKAQKKAAIDAARDQMNTTIDYAQREHTGVVKAITAARIGSETQIAKLEKYVTGHNPFKHLGDDASHALERVTGLTDGFATLEDAAKKANKAENKATTAKVNKGKDQASNVTGNLHLNTGFGTNAAGGAIRRTATSLVGEQGPELAYDPKKSTARILGVHGAELTTVHAGEYILNAKDTKKAMRGGVGTTLRGYAGGTVETGSLSSGDNELPGYAGGTGVNDKKLKKVLKVSSKDLDSFEKKSKKTWKKTSEDTTTSTDSMHKKVKDNYSGLTKDSKNKLNSYRKWNNKNWDRIYSDTKGSSNSIYKYGTKKTKDLQSKLKSTQSSIKKTWKRDWSDMSSSFNHEFDKLHGFSKSGMNKAIGSLNGGTKNINKLISKFGGNKSVLPKINHYATGTMGSIPNDELALLNDSLGRNWQEIVTLPSGHMIEPLQPNTLMPLPEGSGVINGDQAKYLKDNGLVAAHAQGTMSDDQLRKLIDTKSAHPYKAYNKDFAGQVDSVSPMIGDSMLKASKNAMKSIGQKWYKTVWQVLGDVASGAAYGGAWAHRPGSGWLLTSGFGARGATGGGFSSHDGNDFSGAETVHAMHGGRVTRVGGAPAGWGGSNGIGESIVVKGSDGYSVIYQELNGKYNSGAHLLVSEGDTVRTGQAIAKLGASGTHVHVGVTKHPMFSIPGSGTSGWRDITKINSKSSGTKDKKDSKLVKLVKSEIGSKALKWVEKHLAPKDDLSIGLGDGGAITREMISKAESLMHVPSSIRGKVANDILKVAQSETGNRSILQKIHDRNSGGNEARGPLQFTPGTFKHFAVKGFTDIMNPMSQVMAYLNNSDYKHAAGNTSIWGTRKFDWLHSGPIGYRRFANGGIVHDHQLAEIAEGNLPEAVIPLDKSKRPRANELLGEVATMFAKDKNSKLSGADETGIDQKLDTLISMMGQFMRLVSDKPTGITPQAVYNANKQQTTIQTNRYNRSLGLS